MIKGSGQGLSSALRLPYPPPARQARNSSYPRNMCASVAHGEADGGRRTLFCSPLRSPRLPPAAVRASATPLPDPLSPAPSVALHTPLSASLFASLGAPVPAPLSTFRMALVSALPSTHPAAFLPALLSTLLSPWLSLSPSPCSPSALPPAFSQPSSRLPPPFSHSFIHSLAFPLSSFWAFPSNRP